MSGQFEAASADLRPGQTGVPMAACRLAQEDLPPPYLDQSALQSFADVLIMASAATEAAPATEAPVLRTNALTLAALSPILKTLLSEPCQASASVQEPAVLIVPDLSPAHLAELGRFLTTGRVFVRAPDADLDGLRRSFLSMGLPWERIAWRRESASAEEEELCNVPLKTDAVSNTSRENGYRLRRRDREPQPQSGSEDDHAVALDDSAAWEDENDDDDFLSLDVDDVEEEEEPEMLVIKPEPLQTNELEEDRKMNDDDLDEEKATRKRKRRITKLSPKAKRKKLPPLVPAPHNLTYDGPRDPSKKYQCERCHYGNSDYSRFRQHVLRHDYEGDETSGGRKWFCLVCLAPFDKQVEMKRHFRAEHASKDLKCDVCGQIYSGVKYNHYLKHVEEHATGKMATAASATSGASGVDASAGAAGKKEESDMKITCPQCGKKLKDSSTLHSHKRLMGLYHENHCYQCPWEPASDAKPVVFSTWRQHQDHLALAHCGVYRPVCGLCPRSFPDACAWKAHRRDDHPMSQRAKTRASVCDICGKTVYAYALRKHLNDKHGTEQVPCPHCDKIVLSQASLKDHINMCHATFPCDICGKPQKNKQAYQIHVFNIHTPDHEKPFQCRYCPKGFGKKRPWQEHENIHTNARPYKCTFPDCKAAFNNIGNRGHHEKAVHGGQKRPARTKAARQPSNNGVVLQ